jgi:hypothetical protein
VGVNLPPQTVQGLPQETGIIVTDSDKEVNVGAAAQGRQLIAPNWLSDLAIRFMVGKPF